MMRVSSTQSLSISSYLRSCLQLSPLISPFEQKMFIRSFQGESHMPSPRNLQNRSVQTCYQNPKCRPHGTYKIHLSRHEIRTMRIAKCLVERMLSGLTVLLRPLASSVGYYGSPPERWPVEKYWSGPKDSVTFIIIQFMLQHS